jgi:hypothetical protein
MIRDGEYHMRRQRINHQDQGDFRVDHQFGGKAKVFGRFSYALGIQDPDTFSGRQRHSDVGALGHTRTVGTSFASNYLHTFGASRTNELRIGYSTRSLYLSATQLQSAPSASVGIPGIPPNASFGNAMPTFVISGFQQLGPSASAYSDTHTNVTEIADTFAFQVGTHFLKAGLDFRAQRMDIVQPPSPTGTFSFSNVETGFRVRRLRAMHLRVFCSARSIDSPSICSRTFSSRARKSLKDSSRMTGKRCADWW